MMNRFLRRNDSREITLALAAWISLSILLSAPLRGAEENGGIPGGWLTDFRTARALGLGGAFVAMADEPWGSLWNPAGLSSLFKNEISFETAQLFEGTSLNGFSVTVPGRRFPTVGLTMISFRSGDMERTNEFNQSLGTFREGNQAFLLSVSRDLFPYLSAGMNVRIIRQSIEGFSDTGAGLDFGMMINLSGDLSVGASIVNVGGPDLELRRTREHFPAEFRGGFALRVLSGRAMISAQIGRLAGTETNFNAGTEFWLYPQMAFRLGFNSSSPSGGFCWRLPHDMRVDYGMDSHELGLTHHFSLTYSFGGFFAKSQAEPEVFSPLGRQPVTKFHLNSRTKKEVQEWRLEITDKFNRLVRAFGGNGDLPAHLMWDGKDDAGKAMSDGEYSYRLRVRDFSGREIDGPSGTVVIDTSIPRISVPVISEKK
ncbi:MAG: PorV/PorQ family protein [Candidatus Krumholzibacteriota bacterium]|nr:PorV/PorQ family protein [Candidatus Krumholzibacteriota bacterium]